MPKYVGECHDRFRRTDGGWRFASRRVEVAFRRGTSVGHDHQAMP